MNGSEIHSRVFGYNPMRYLFILILGGISIYLISEGQMLASLFAIVPLVLTILFSIGTHLKDNKLKIDILGVPVKTIPVSEIQEVSQVDSPFYERHTFGFHQGPQGSSFHAGPAHLSITLKSGKTYRVSVDDPNAFISALHKQLAPAA